MQQSVKQELKPQLARLITDGTLKETAEGLKLRTDELHSGQIKQIGTLMDRYGVVWVIKRSGDGLTVIFK